jgi:glycosyltransferase involved in cell wall biosynthesis
MELPSGGRKYLAEARTIAENLTEFGADIIHSHVYHADFVGYLAGRRARVSTVATYHGHTGGDVRNRLYEWADRRLLTRFDAAVCVSQRNLDRLVRVGGVREKLHLIPNGMAPVDTLIRARARAEIGLRPEGPVLGWVGRLSHEKGPDLLIEAVARLDMLDVELVVIGDGPERDTLKSLATKVGVSTNFVGERDGAASFLAAFDVLISSSRTEGLPMVLLEAMSAGTPVVAFGVGGIPQLLNENTGWVVPPGDVHRLAEAAQEALGDPAEAARRAGRAREIIDREYGVELWLDRLESVYDGLGRSR